MIATAFDEENLLLERPTSMNEDECTTLPVWYGVATNGAPTIVSCWKLTKEELEEINRTGRVWLMVLSNGMPPVALSGLYPFERT